MERTSPAEPLAPAQARRAAAEFATQGADADPLAAIALCVSEIMTTRAFGSRARESGSLTRRR